MILFFPAIAGLSLFVLPWSDRGARSFSLTVSVICAALTLWLWSLFEAGSSEMQFEESLEWIPSFGIRYSVGVDGVSLLMVALTTLLSLIVVLLSFSSGQARVREYLGCALVLQTGLFGSFLATDLFLFYVFCEFILIPVYFLIGVWGGSHRVAATLKFALHSVTGSLLLLVAIVYAVWSVRDSGSISFDIAELTSRLRATELGTAEVWLFLGFATAFAIKVPIFPFHTWFPEAQVDASTGGAVILGGAVVQIGCYGFLRFALSMFPRASLALLPAIATLAVVGIVYGALVAMVQTDIRKLIAYASMSQIGFVVLGLSSMTVVGVSGGVVQMLNHGVSLCGLLVLAGILLERGQSLDLDACGGLAYLMPRYATAFVLVMLSAVGLPGLNGFIGKFMILVGMFSSQGMIVGASVAEFAAFACALAGVLGVGAVILV
ncbi:MAG: NADH-quinone oxidoreductase subunit M, partial [Myxococcota bacterium]